MVSIDSSGAVSYSASIENLVVVSVTVFEKFDTKAIFPYDASLKLSLSGSKLIRMRVIHFRLPHRKNLLRVLSWTQAHK